MTSSHVLGVDPSAASDPHVGWAIVTVEASPKLVRAGLVLSASQLPMDGEEHIVTVAVEDQYLAKNPKVALNLAAARGEIVGRAKGLGLNVVLVPATAWQRAIGANGKRQERKIHARNVAERIWGPEIVGEWTQDTVDASLIARFAAVELWSAEQRSAAMRQFRRG